MSIKISVIIPVYNAEKYLSHCIESLLNQTLQACEFIFINDGSADNSQKIIEEFMKLDSRIKLINQDNQGVSIARNRGLEMAAGEYIGFVDADDYIEADMFETLYNSAKQDDCDVVFCDFKSEADGHKTTNSFPFVKNTLHNDNYIISEILPYFLREENLNSVCNKIFKNKVITNNEIKFPEGVSHGEDGMFNLLYFCKASTMKYIDYSGYYYREVMGSATRNLVKTDYFNKALEIYNMKLPEILICKIDKSTVLQLRSIKLIKSVMSFIYLYFAQAEDLSFSKRYGYIKEMITHNSVNEALSNCYSDIHYTLGRYEKFILSMIRRRSMFGLFCATAYSRFRNR